MANRRLGGGMGNLRGNRSFSQPQPFQGSNVNPWQGNAGNSMNQGLLSQISTNPQQLALALTSLLQPQQQMSNPPSLLSLNTSPAFSNQDSIGRFGSRGRNDFRRHEPYNKNQNRTGWRQFANKKPGGGGGGGGGRDNRNRDVKKGTGKDNKDAKDTKSDKKADDKVDTIDLSTDDKDEDAKDRSDMDKDDKRYTGIPQGLLHCFVCNKNMWDGESFHKHVRGRAHKQMLQSLDESFHITVNILRESMRLTEEKKLIELNRMERLSKKQRKYEQESNCNMCDLKFLGKIIAHRKTEGHQRLKRFLHPNCETCNQEFSSRMDWVEHRLTEEHLKQLAEYMEKRKDAEDGNEIIEEDELDLEPLLEETMLCEDEKPILELSEDLKDLQNRIPAYKKSRAISTESLQPFSGFVCELCHRSFTSEEIAQAHLKTQRHYHNFVEAAKNKYKKQMDDAAAEKAAKDKADKEAKEDKEKGEENGDDMYDPEEACKEGDQTMESQDEEASQKEEDELLNNEDSKEDEEDEDVTMVEEEEKEEKEKEKEPPKPAATTTSPRTVRSRAAAAATAASTPSSNVKNGAGPKSKKARK